MNKILTLETNKYAVKLDNFEGPLDLLCHLIDKKQGRGSSASYYFIGQDGDGWDGWGWKSIAKLLHYLYGAVDFIFCKGCRPIGRFHP